MAGAIFPKTKWHDEEILRMLRFWTEPKMQKLYAVKSKRDDIYKAISEDLRANGFYRNCTQVSDKLKKIRHSWSKENKDMESGRIVGPPSKFFMLLKPVLDPMIRIDQGSGCNVDDSVLSTQPTQDNDDCSSSTDGGNEDGNDRQSTNAYVSANEDLSRARAGTSMQGASDVVQDKAVPEDINNTRDEGKKAGTKDVRFTPYAPPKKMSRLQIRRHRFLHNSQIEVFQVFLQHYKWMWVNCSKLEGEKI